MTPEELLDAAVAARAHKAETYLAGLTDTGKALHAETTDLHYLWDVRGRTYLDLTSGGGALPMGSYHLVNKAIWNNPAATFPHVLRYGDATVAVQAEYAEEISKRFPLVDGVPQKVHFTVSGDEAQTLAIKYAQACSIVYLNLKPVDARTYLPMDTGQAQKICELAQGPIIIDERLTGYGRLGAFRAAERYGLDAYADRTFTVFGEAGGGGIPFGAVVGPARLMDLDIRDHDQTRFGGNPIACAAGLIVLRMQNGEFYEHVRDQSHALEVRAEELRTQFPAIVADHQGRGLLRSLRLTDGVDPELVSRALLNAGVIVDVVYDPATHAVRLLLAPPLIMTDAALGEAFNQIAEALVAVEKTATPA